MRPGQRRNPTLPYNAKIVYDEFKRMYKEEGRPPTIREMQEELSWAFKSTSSIKYHLDNLVILGVLGRDEGKSRNYYLIDDEAMQVTRDASGIIEVTKKIAYRGSFTLDDMLDIRRELAKMGIDYERSVS